MTIKRRFGRLKYYLNRKIKLEEEMDKIQEEIDKLDWSEEGRTQKIRLFQEMGKMMEFWRMDRITIKWEYTNLLKNANLTG